MLPKAVRRSILLALPFQVASIVVAVALSFFEFDFNIEVWLTLLLIPLFWVPAVAELLFRTTMPWPLQLSYLIFIAAGPFAGTALHVYWVVPVWDMIVHLESGLMLAWLGMFWVQRAEARIGAAIPRWFAVTVILATPLAVGAIWEICEFASDMLVGTQTQHGLDDSMTDLIAALLGALIALTIAITARRPRTLLPLEFLPRQ